MVISLLLGKRTKYLVVLLGRDTQVQSISTTAFESGRRGRRGETVPRESCVVADASSPNVGFAIPKRSNRCDWKLIYAALAPPFRVWFRNSTMPSGQVYESHHSSRTQHMRTCDRVSYSNSKATKQIFGILPIPYAPKKIAFPGPCYSSGNSRSLRSPHTEILPGNDLH